MEKYSSIKCVIRPFHATKYILGENNHVNLVVQFSVKIIKL